MTFHYALFENNLTSDPDDYAAQIQLALPRRAFNRATATQPFLS